MKCGYVALWCLCGLASVNGCKLGPKEVPIFSAPAAIFTIDHYSGSPISGPTTQPVSASPDAISVSVELLAVEQPPVDAGRPLASEARWLLATRGDQPVLPSGKLSKSARLLAATPTDLKMGRAASFGKAIGALPAGATAAVILDVPTADFPARRFELMLHRPPSAGALLQIAVGFRDRYQPPRPIEPTDEPTTRPATAPTKAPAKAVEEVLPPLPPTELIRELVVFERPYTATPDAFSILVPIAFEGSEAKGVLAHVRIVPAGEEPLHDQALASAMAQIGRSITRATSRPSLLAVGPGAGSAFDIAVQTLRDPKHRRSAMAFLASQCRAPLCEDVALAGEDDVLAALAEKLLARIPVPVGAMTSDALGWVLDSTTFTFLGELLSAAKLPPELAAVLVSHTGEVGRSPGSVEEVSKALGQRSAFEARIAAENLIFLEDNAPSSRVRAFDWLAARKLAPPGYDPLAPPRQRRAALEKAMNAALAPTTAPATRQGGQP